MFLRFFFYLQKFVISCMNKMENLFQEQRRTLLLSMVYAKQGLPPHINKESMKQPLKEQKQQQAIIYKNVKRPQEQVQQQQPSKQKQRTSDKKKQKSVQDVSF